MIQFILELLKKEVTEFSSACRRQIREFKRDHLRVFYLVLLILAGFLFLNVRLNDLKDHANLYYSDEIHTIGFGKTFIENGTIEDFRVPEGSRWVFRALYPIGLIRMNQVLGGNHFTQGWAFPGIPYLSQHYPTEASIQDPSVAEFFLTIRMGSAILLFLSLLPVLHELFALRLIFTPIVMIVLLGGSDFLLQEQRLFYVEPIQLSVLNLLLANFLHSFRKSKFERKEIIISAILVSFAIACKFSAIFAWMFPITTLFYFTEGWRSMIRKAGFLCLGIFASWLVWSFPAFLSLDRFNHFLQDTTANFWHYSVGHTGMDDPGLNHWAYLAKCLWSTFGYLPYLFPFLFAAGWLSGDRKCRYLIACISLFLFLTFYSISTQALYWSRNTLPWIGLLAFLFGFSLETLWKCFRESGRQMRGVEKCVWVLVLSLTWILGVGRASGSHYFEKFNFSLQTKLEASVRIHHDEKILQKLYTVDQVYNGEVPHENRPGVPLVKGDDLRNYELSWFHGLKGGDAVLVKRVSRNFQLSNFILPKVFRHFDRFGDTFLFYDLNEGALKANAL